MAERAGNGGGPFEIAMVVVMSLAAIGIVVLGVTFF